MTVRLGTLYVVLLLWAAGFALAGVTPTDSKTGPSIEQQLLDDLQSDPLDADVQRELFGPDQQPAPPEDRPGEPSKGAEDDLDQRLLEELGAAAVSEDDNPLLDVARQMRMAEQRIVEADSGSATQDLQKQIVDAMEALLEQARKSCSGQCKPSENPQQVAARKPVSQPKQPKPGKGGQKPSEKPVRNPQTRAGSAAPRRPDMQEMRDLLKEVWGELPAAEREQMLELPVEEFLPQYELLIEAYFKRLAEQQEVERWPADRQPPR